MKEHIFQLFKYEYGVIEFKKVNLKVPLFIINNLFADREIQWIVHINIAIVKLLQQRFHAKLIKNGLCPLTNGLKHDKYEI